MLPIRNGSSFHYCNKGSEASLPAISQQNTILSEKAKSFSIFLQIGAFADGNQRTKKEMKQNLRCFISFI